MFPASEPDKKGLSQAKATVFRARHTILRNLMNGYLVTLCAAAEVLGN